MIEKEAATLEPSSVKFSRIDPNMFFKTLHTRVNKYFKENQINKSGNYKMVLKTIIMFTLYVVPFLLVLFKVITGFGVLLMFLIMGLGIAGIGLSIMHDANHGSYSKNKMVNKILSYSMNFIGGSSFTWKMQHNLMHHTYTNVYHLDEDIDDKPFLRLSPHGKLKKYHRFQHLYAPLLYALATISWISFKDFKQLRIYNATGLTEKTGYSPLKQSIILVLSKVCYFAIVLVLPIVLGVKWYFVLPGFILAHLVAGLIITVIFQLAHLVEGPEHHDAMETPEMENTWAIHQLKTTANFSPGNKLITWYAGGLNFQIEHHLFPNICHVHYPQVAKIVRKTVKEFNLPYYENVKFLNAYRSHMKVLKSLGNPNSRLLDRSNLTYS
ncbi:fatty acid desaturase family protein [Portibacter marinus]|uniref:fatty acid desaturase family protein n=1 Tax=Portibacter marinus TaxID=2898660 RepID=UPI001F1AAE08|nr:acyl-CoA desaturase [Portibacter marinus]